MQEEVTQRTVALCVEATKLSAGMLQQAMKKVLDEMQKGVTGHKTKLHHGKQTLRQLMKHNTGVSNIEITDQNIRAFSATAKKYGIDFALKKDTSGEIPRYLVFFKGRDADVITAAFREFSAKNLEKEKKPSIRKELEQAKQQAKAQHRQREKVKTIGPVFQSYAPGLGLLDLAVGVAVAVILYFVVQSKIKKARKFRRDMEYGSARWSA